MKASLPYILLFAFGLIAPFVPFLSPYTTQIAILWMMILFALTWDLMGGQMGYNSLGNILFFGIGMYASAVLQISVGYDVGDYTAAYGAIKPEFSNTQYFVGIVGGIVFAAVLSAALAALLGSMVFGLRGAYFAIGTLGLALAAAELIGGWDYVGGGAGISMPPYPFDPVSRSLMFYYMLFGLALVTLLVLRWLYRTRFGLAINAIRDNENKAEAMGMYTKRYKTIAWCISAFFLGASGAVFGNMSGFIEPLEVAFPTVTFGIFMVAMSLLGGKGTLWGPVLGAVLFHIVKEVTWTYLLGWQWVALGAIIIVNVVFFQQGILGWAMDKWPHRFGIEVDRGTGGTTAGATTAGATTAGATTAGAKA